MRSADLRRPVCSRAAAALIVALVVAGMPAGAQVMDRELRYFIDIEQLEHRAIPRVRPVLWDAVAWVGGDFNRLWIRTSGARSARNEEDEVRVEALYGRMVTPFWDALIGAQVESRTIAGTRRSRTGAVVALEGLAPYRLKMEPSLFISARGDLSAELATTADLYVTQRLLVQPRVDLHAALQTVREFGVGSGLGDAGIGLRARYEVYRELAPYIGIQWNRSFAETARLARAAGEVTGSIAFVGGLRLWF